MSLEPTQTTSAPVRAQIVIETEADCDARFLESLRRIWMTELHALKERFGYRVVAELVWEMAEKYPLAPNENST